MALDIVAHETATELAAWKSVMRSLLGESAFAAVESAVRAELNDP